MSKLVKILPALLEAQKEIEALTKILQLAKDKYGAEKIMQLARFATKIDIQNDGCWIWTSTIDNIGYGRCSSKLYGEKKAHKLSWRIFKGEIPKGKHILHKCDNRACVNPHHLFSGTHKDNMVDMVFKGRNKPNYMFGEANPMSRLTRESVRKIRETYEKEDVTQAELAKRFNVSRMAINRAVRRISWKYI